MTSLLRQLKLPLDERGRRRAANRAEWFTQVDKPLEIHDIIERLRRVAVLLKLLPPALIAAARQDANSASPERRTVTLLTAASRSLTGFQRRPSEPKVDCCTS